MIKYTRNLHLDFEKATEEITKLKDRILGYQEQVASLRTSIRNFKKSRESEIKYEYDVRVKVVKVKHEFFYYAYCL